MSFTLRKFRIAHIFRYIMDFPHYLEVYKYENYVDKLREIGSIYGVVKGTDEVYVHDVNDRAIPTDMYFNKKTFSSDEIDLFFDFVYSKKGLLPTAELGGVFLDIGSNIGTTCIYAAKHYDGANMRYIAFEPDRKNYTCLAANVILNECDNIRTVNSAVSDSYGKAEMLVDEKNRGGTRIVQKSEDKHYNTGQYSAINKVKLDDFLNEIGVDYSDITMIWMDVEGHEGYAVHGMMEMLKKARPCIYMELTPKSSTIVPENVFDMLYNDLSTIYNKIMIPDIVDEKNEAYVGKIDYMKELYHTSKRQYNILIFCED